MNKTWTYNELTEQIIAAAIEVHRELGPGLLEKVYEECLCRELELLGVPFRRQVIIPITYKGERLESIYRCDLWVANMVVVEVKAIEAFNDVHHAQLLGYLKLMDQRLGLLINFNVKLLKQGIRRMANSFEGGAFARAAIAHLQCILCGLRALCGSIWPRMRPYFRPMPSTLTVPALYSPANFINGAWMTEGDGTFNTVIDKYHGSALARIPHATEAQMEEAIAAAYASRDTVRKLSAGDRSAKLEALAALIADHEEELAMLIVQEGGKPIGYAKAEIARCITTVRTAAAETLRFTGETLALDYGAGAGKTAFTKRFPIGVIAAITPFNFPLNLVLHKVAPAMAVGCPVVLKPAPQAPLSALALGKLIEEVGWPKGAFSVLLCGVPVAEKLVKDERVAMLSFTGSDKVGWHLKAICGKKKVALELGGNASVIVDEGVDLASTVKTVAIGANVYAGQTCISTQRIYVVKSVFAQFRDLLVKEYAALKAGDPSDASVTVGPIIDKGHFDRIAHWVNEAVTGGAQVLSGGKAVDIDRNIYAPTLLTSTTTDMKVSCAEVFGPVAILEEVTDFGEAIARVNDSTYGLQAGVFTDSVANMKRAHDELEVGGIIINNVPGFRLDSMPYGGIKDSGLGREGVKYAMEEMSEPRLLVY